MDKPYIYWKIREHEDNNKIQMIDFYLEKNGGTKLVHTEELENVIGDYAEQREDNWVTE